MPLLVVNRATLVCSMGQAPSRLVVLSANRRLVGSEPAATVADHVPMKNVQPFGLCMAGTPQPCVPSTPAPWQPGSTLVTMDGERALVATDTCQCGRGGTLSVADAGQPIVTG